MNRAIRAIISSEFRITKNAMRCVGGLVLTLYERASKFLERSAREQEKKSLSGKEVEHLIRDFTSKIPELCEFEVDPAFPDEIICQWQSTSEIKINRDGRDHIAQLLHQATEHLLFCASEDAYQNKARKKAKDCVSSGSIKRVLQSNKVLTLLFPGVTEEKQENSITL